MSVEAQLEKNVITTKLSEVIKWARKNSLWPMPFGTACCAIEFMGVISAHYDMARFGAEVVRFSPRQSDLLIVAGTVTDKMGPVLKRIYDQMPEPKWVIAMGVCASSGGFYRAYHVMQGIDEIIPVDVYIPGCPPPPEAILDALIKLQKKIEGTPLSAAELEEEQRALHPPEIDASVTQLSPPSPALLEGTGVEPDPQKPVLKRLRELFPDAITKAEDFRGDLSVTIKRERLLEVCRALRDDPALDFNFLMDVAGVDYYTRQPDRFESVYHLYSLDKQHRLRLKVPVPESDPTVDSVVSVWRGANWHEREAFDMFGIKYNGHPDLRKILTHNKFLGYALRKDHDPGKRYLLKENDATTLADVPSEWPRQDKIIAEPKIINIGPSHPATHGVFRISALLDGETIVDSDVEIGYMHRCFEKMSETHFYQQVMPYTDRLNYVSAFLNNVGYCIAVEKLLGIEVPRRAQYLRVILGEFSRIMDHLVCITTNVVDLGAITAFWYGFRPREEIYDLLESCCGARLTVSYGRIGGVADDIPPGFKEKAVEVLKHTEEFVNDLDRLLSRNRIFRDRTRHVGAISKQDAIEWGFTGPCLRAAGVPYDIRKDHPYSGYEDFDFDIPVGANGDTYDRYLVRMEEIRQSMRIIYQALEGLPEGPIAVDDRRITLPPKQGVYSNIEDLMNHFKLIMHGILPPVGEVYSYTEAANGELGFYIISDGTARPYRIKCRAPCFAIFQAFSEMVEGGMISDAIAVLGSLNIVAGELER